MNNALSVLSTTPRLTEVMSRIRIDLTPVLQGSEITGLRSAARQCQECPHVRSCEQWSQQREQGEAHEPPVFCPALAFLSACTQGFAQH